MHTDTRGGDFVYLHDDVGGGRAVVTASMLLMLNGEAWPDVQQKMTTAELNSLSYRQRRAIGQLISALHSGVKSQAGNPYSGARIGPW